MEINRRHFFRLAGMGIAGTLAGSFAFSCDRKPSQPNILFLFTDDQRFNTIRALNNPAVQTPHLDRLVKNGVSFTNAYIMGGFSGAICMPSRAMLMTGRHLFNIEDNGRHIPDDHILMPEYLQSLGYDTFGTGKWHNGRAAYARCFNHGGEIMFGGMGDHWNVRAHDFDPSGQYDQTTPVIKDPFSGNEISREKYDHIHEGKHSSELFAEATLDFLNNRDRNKPFFAYVSFMAPHDPRSMPEEYKALYDPETIELPPNFMPEHPFDNGELRIRDEMLEDHPRTPEAIRTHIAEYYAMITHLDAQIGRLLLALEENGDLENTVIVFAGDNGLAVGQHGLLGKQNVYEHSVHVPLVMSGPGLPKGETRESFCYLFDIFPTLCDHLGFEIPESVDGQSLVPAIKDAGVWIRDQVFFAYKNFQRGYRKGNWKLIKYNVNGLQRTQLFDLAADPWERNDLSANPDYQEQVNSLTRALEGLMKETNDPADLGQVNWGVPQSKAWAS